MAQPCIQKPKFGGEINVSTFMKIFLHWRFMGSVIGIYNYEGF